MKTIDDALELRGRIFGAFEMAETEPDPGARREWLTFAVVGGGATGVEIAGQIVELAHHALTRDFRRIDPGDARVLLFEGGDQVLANFGDKLSAKATRQLERVGVEVRCSAMVTGIDAFGVDVRGPDGTVERIGRAPRCGRPACRPPRWPPCWQRPRGRAATEPAASRCSPTARCRAIPKCSASAT